MKIIQMKTVVWSLPLILFAVSVCSAQSVLYLPQFVDGIQPSGNVFWASAIAITNPAPVGTPAATGTITLTQDNGTPLNVAFFDENHAPAGNTFQLAGGQTKFFDWPVLNGGPVLGQPFSSGFATVSSNLPVVAGLVFYEGGATGALIGEAGVLAATPLTRQAIVAVKDNNTNTGVAIANPRTAGATLTFQLLDKSATEIAPQVTRPLPANNHTAFFVSDLFPNVTSKIYGTMRITSDVPIVSTGLLFSLTSFATLPVVPLQ
jgi:hypothetical protein